MVRREKMAHLLGNLSEEDWLKCVHGADGLKTM